MTTASVIGRQLAGIPALDAQHPQLHCRNARVDQFDLRTALKTEFGKAVLVGCSISAPSKMALTNRKPTEDRCIWRYGSSRRCVFQKHRLPV